MKLGFIGTGKITSAVITGICSSSISYNKIIISERNKSTSSILKKKFKKITVSKDNQEIINSCDWIFLSVTPTVGEKIIKNLKFRSNQTVISFISTITLALSFFTCDKYSTSIAITSRFFLSFLTFFV